MWSITVAEKVFLCVVAVVVVGREVEYNREPLFCVAVVVVLKRITHTRLTKVDEFFSPLLIS